MKNYDNMSLDKKVGFLEKGHIYELIENPNMAFNSVTTIIKDLHEEFKTDEIIQEIINNPKSPYYKGDPEEIKKKWREKAEKASGEGTLLHAYGEALFKGTKIKNPPVHLPKAEYVPIIIEELYAKGYELAKAELLVYSEILALAGQSDIILKKKDPLTGEYDYMIYDWKFLGKPLQKNSRYDPTTRKYKMMYGPFKYLKDCNWIHYSIQLAIYQALIGTPEKVKEKVLVCVYDDGYEYVPAYPIRVFWDENLELQAVYETWGGKIYNSRTGKFTKTWPKDIKGR